MTQFDIKSLTYLHLDNINLSLTSDDFTCVNGVSGSGKSLLLRCLVDLVPHQGEIFLNNKSINTYQAPEWRRQVGLLPAEPAWWSDSVSDHFPEVNLAEFAQLGFSKDVLDWQINRLSSGERQRLSLLRLLSIKPAVLLLDEPTANLDPTSTLNVEALVQKYRQEHSCVVLWVSHNPEQTQRLATQAYEMKPSGLEQYSV